QRAHGAGGLTGGHGERVPAVGHLADRAVEPAVAEVGHATRAGGALATGGGERPHDVVPGRHVRGPVTDGLDDTRALVPADDRQSSGKVPARDVQVRVAQARDLPLDEHLAVVGSVELAVDELVLSSQLAGDGGRGLHRTPSGCAGRPPALKRILITIVAWCHAIHDYRLRV